MSITQIKIAIALALVASLIGGHVYLVNRAVARAEAVQLAEFNKQVMENVLRTIETEDQLKLGNKALMDKKNEDLSRITAERNRLNRMLSNRPQRDPAISIPASPGAACTGAELYRQDGEFLAGEAARAEKVMRERDYYYDQYEQARKKIDEFNRAK